MPISLVTGGAGFIGSHVSNYLLEIGHRVVVLDDLSEGFKDNVPQGAEFVKGSILEQGKIADLLSRFDFFLFV